MKNFNSKAAAWAFICLSGLVFPGSAPGAKDEFAILLHGLARTSHSMSEMAGRLAAEGYRVINLDYPSRTETIEALAESVLAEAIMDCRNAGAKKIHFVTHSMGGIIVWYYLKHHEMKDLGKVVMLSPPNKGSEVVDKLEENFIFKWVNGPAGQQLGTVRDALPRQLGKVDFELGVIAGDRSINPILSLMIPGEDDGKVSVANAAVPGMTDFITIAATHTFIINDSEAIEQTLAFLKSGKFQK